MGYERTSIANWRRKRALDLRDHGWRQCEMATALDVTPGTVSKWLHAADQNDGVDGLVLRPRPGRPSRLTEEQKQRIPDFLWHGAEAYGFRGEVWTCLRVVDVLKEEFGVRYSKSQVSRLLKSLGWTPQVPLTRAIQRDEAAIQHWQAQKWPRIQKQAHGERRTLVFIDESGFYLLPSVVKTYAPRGVTPILKEWQTQDHLSVMGGLTSEGKIFTLVRQKSLNGLHTVKFLIHLQHMVGERLLVIWDGSPIHRRREVGEFLAQGAARQIHIEPLPFYAPDLNPVEWLWRHLKEAELCNLACLDLEQLHMEFHLAVGRVRCRSSFVSSFFAGAGLPIQKLPELCNAQ